MASDPAELFFKFIEAELNAERAAVLGRYGRRIEEALAACEALEPTMGGDSSKVAYRAARERVMKAIADLCFQREMIGLHDHSWVHRIYQVPPPVQPTDSACDPRTRSAPVAE